MASMNNSQLMDSADFYTDRHLARCVRVFWAPDDQYDLKTIQYFQYDFVRLVLYLGLEGAKKHVKSYREEVEGYQDCELVKTYEKWRMISQ